MTTQELAARVEERRRRAVQESQQGTPAVPKAPVFGSHVPRQRSKTPSGRTRWPHTGQRGFEAQGTPGGGMASSSTTTTVEPTPVEAPSGPPDPATPAQGTTSEVTPGQAEGQGEGTREDSVESTGIKVESGPLP